MKCSILLLGLVAATASAELQVSQARLGIRSRLANQASMQASSGLASSKGDSSTPIMPSDRSCYSSDDCLAARVKFQSAEREIENAVSTVKSTYTNLKIGAEHVERIFNIAETKTPNATMSAKVLESALTIANYTIGPGYEGPGANERMATFKQQNSLCKLNFVELFQNAQLAVEKLDKFYSNVETKCLVEPKSAWKEHCAGLSEGLGLTLSDAIEASVVPMYPDAMAAAVKVNDDFATAGAACAELTTADETIDCYNRLLASNC